MSDKLPGCWACCGPMYRDGVNPAIMRCGNVNCEEYHRPHEAPPPPDPVLCDGCGCPIEPERAHLRYGLACGCQDAWDRFAAQFPAAYCADGDVAENGKLIEVSVMFATAMMAARAEAMRRDAR